MKFELCNAVTNSEEVVLATEYVSLRELSNFRGDDALFLPSFGPSYVDFYSRPSNLRIKKTNIDAEV